MFACVHPPITHTLSQLRAAPLSQASLRMRPDHPERMPAGGVAAGLGAQPRLSAELVSNYKRGLTTFWNERSAKYAQNFQAFHAPLVDTLIELAPLREGQAVLDVATGTGQAAYAAAARVGAGGSVLGIDISPGMIAEVRPTLEAANRCAPAHRNLHCVVLAGTIS